jgi:hypothetical protein
VVTCLCWIIPKHSSDDALIYGTSTGFVGIYRKDGRGDTLTFAEVSSKHLWANSLALMSPDGTKQETGEITAFAYDDGSRYLACATYTGQLHLLRIGPHMRFENVWSRLAQQFTPMGLSFQPSSTGAVAPELWIFGLGKVM